MNGASCTSSEQRPDTDVGAEYRSKLYIKQVKNGYIITVQRETTNVLRSETKVFSTLKEALAELKEHFEKLNADINLAKLKE